MLVIFNTLSSAQGLNIVAVPESLTSKDEEVASPWQQELQQLQLLQLNPQVDLVACLGPQPSPLTVPRMDTREINATEKRSRQLEVEISLIFPASPARACEPEHPILVLSRAKTRTTA